MTPYVITLHREGFSKRWEKRFFSREIKANEYNAESKLT